MKVITYFGDENCPKHLRHAARIILPDGSLHPVVFHGDEPQGQRAQEWWDAEVEKARNAKPRGRRKAENPIGAAAAFDVL